MSEIELREVPAHESYRYFLYYNYLSDESLGDTCIICSDGNIRAHSLILMENPVFNGVLTSQAKKEQKVFKIPQFCKSVMRVILEYIYIKEARYGKNIEDKLQKAVDYFFGPPKVKTEPEENAVLQYSETSLNLEGKPLVTDYFSTPSTSRSHKVEAMETEQIVVLENNLNLEENTLVTNIPVPNEDKGSEYYLTAREDSAGTSQTVQVAVTTENNTKENQNPVQRDEQLATKKGKKLLNPFAVDKPKSADSQVVPKYKKPRVLFLGTDEEDVSPAPVLSKKKKTKKSKKKNFWKFQ